jgi:phosphoglycolate phosphatase
MVNLLDAFDLFIFDLDGTLVDSHLQIEKALNQARIDLNLPTTPKNHVWENLGKPVTALLSDLMIEENLQIALIEIFRKHLGTLISKNNVSYPFASNLLHFLLQEDKKVALATGKSTSMARAVIDNSDLKGLFNHVQGTDNFEHKPNPTVINLCLKEFPGMRSVMIGDRQEDILAARNAGIPSVGISQSADSPEVLKSYGAEQVFNNIQCLYFSLLKP